VKAFLSHSPSLVITTSLLSSSHQKKLLLLHEKLSKPNEEFQLEDNDRMSNNDSKKVLVGSKEYLNGFISTPITEQRDGDGLEQTLKLGGGVTVGLVVLLLGFMASNGLL
jgi:hypothetical protein